MAGDYVQLTFTDDPDTLTDAALDALASAWTGWTANDGDFEVVLLENHASLATEAIRMASNMPAAALIAYGTKLLGVPYDSGSVATVTATINVDDTIGHTIPAGSEFSISTFAFQTANDLVIPAGSSSGTVTLSANDTGVAYNGLDDTDIAPVSAPVYVTTVTFAGVTAGGTDPQDDQDYLDALSARLRLRAQSIITLVDFQIVALLTPGIGRAVALASGTNPRAITVTVTDDNGAVATTTAKNALTTALAATRMVNATTTVADPTYTTVNVAYEVLALPGFDAATLRAQINARLALELSPGGWGLPRAGDPGIATGQWVNHNVIHLNRIVSVIGGILGVDYVVSATLNGAAADLTLTGTVALPNPGTMTGTIDLPTV